MKTKHRTRPATPAESARALANVRLLFQMTPREQAEERMREAKARFTEAAQAALRGDADAEQAGIDAYAAVVAAQADLAALEGR